MHFVPQSFYCQGLFRDVAKYRTIVQNATYLHQIQQLKQEFESDHQYNQLYNRTAPTFNTALDSVFLSTSGAQNSKVGKPMCLEYLASFGVCAPPHRTKHGHLAT